MLCNVLHYDLIHHVRSGGGAIVNMSYNLCTSFSTSDIIPFL